MIAGLLLDQVLIALILLAVTSLFTSLQRMYHVWRLTGGEDGGWAPAKESFEIPGPREPVSEGSPGPVDGEPAEPR